MENCEFVLKSFKLNLFFKKWLNSVAKVTLISSYFQVTYEAIKIPKWSSLSEMHPIDYYSSYTKNCTGEFTKQEVRNIRAFYYAMCAETDAMLGR